jgi:hypothetical protein
MLILKENVADKKKWSFFKITKSVNYFWSDMKDARLFTEDNEVSEADNSWFSSFPSVKYNSFGCLKLPFAVNALSGQSGKLKS